MCNKVFQTTNLSETTITRFDTSFSSANEFVCHTHTSINGCCTTPISCLEDFVISSNFHRKREYNRENCIEVGIDIDVDFCRIFLNYDQDIV